MTFDEIDEIKQLLDIVREHELSEFELEREGFKIRIRKGVATVAAPVPAQAQGPAFLAPPAPAAAQAPAASAAAAPATPPAAADDDDGELELAVVKSPIVGTFYRAPEPGAPDFVQIGQVVKRNQVLCIIEAMKLMNEITSEYEGELVKAYVENGQPVQYGERLFAIKAK
jgi:acetyl-CoA carboxylase biotin carboxyl carrier protein